MLFEKSAALAVVPEVYLENTKHEIKPWKNAKYFDDDNIAFCTTSPYV